VLQFDNYAGVHARRSTRLQGRVCPGNGRPICMAGEGVGHCLDRRGFVAYNDQLMMESAVFHRFVPLRIALTVVAIRFPLRRLSAS
jgi:hypothetical protein